MPVVLLASGVATFALVGAAGLSVIDRYLLVPSLMVMVFAASRSAAGRCCATARGRGASGPAGRCSLVRLRRRLHGDARQPRPASTPSCSFRGDAHDALQDAHRPSRASRPGLALRSGVGRPNHKLVPDVRWYLDLPQDEVIARSDRRTRCRTSAASRSSSHGRAGALRQALVTEFDDPMDSLPPPGFRRVAVVGVLRGVCPLLGRRPDAGERSYGPPLVEHRREGSVVLWRLGRRRRPRCWRSGCALWGVDARPALRLQRRRERALRAARDRAVRPRPGTRTTSSTRRPTRTSCTSSSPSGSAGARAVADAFATDPTAVFVVARAATAAVLGTVAVGLLYLAGTRLVRPPRRPARRRAAGRRVPAGLLLHLALNDVPTLAPLCARAVGHGGRPARRAATLRLPPRRDRPRPRVRDEVHRRDRAAAAARGVRRPAAPRGRRAPALRAASLLAGVVALAAFVVANPYAILDFDAFRDGLSHQSDAAGDAVGQARPDPGQRLHLLPVDVHLGARLGAARRGRSSARSLLAVATTGGSLACLAPAPILFVAVHGLAGALLRPLAACRCFPFVCLLAALRRDRARRRAATRRRAGAAPDARRARARSRCCGQGLVYSAAHRAGPVARGHPQPDARLARRARPRRHEDRRRAGRPRRLGAGHRHGRRR